MDEAIYKEVLMYRVRNDGEGLWDCGGSLQWSRWVWGEKLEGFFFLMFVSFSLFIPLYLKQHYLTFIELH